MIQIGPKSLYRMLSGAWRLGNWHERRAAAFLSPQQIVSGQKGEFDCRSLLAWIEIARKANVPFVDAVPWMTLAEAEISALLEGRPLDTEEMDRKAAEATDALKHGWIVRHDHMGSARLKIQASIGEPPSDGHDPIGWIRIGNFAFPDIGDERHYKAVIECGSGIEGDFDQVFVQRPWIETQRRRGIDPHREGWECEGEWPREWRAFIMDSKVEGISNYYLQTPATGDAADQIQLAKVGEYASAMLAEMGGLVPACMMLTNIQNRSAEIRERMPIGSINGTLDFIVREDGEVLFLEGGPPYTPPPFRWGGHPCCFLGREWPDGIALALDAGVHPMWQGIGETSEAA